MTVVAIGLMTFLLGLLVGFANGRYYRERSHMTPEERRRADEKLQHDLGEW